MKSQPFLLAVLMGGIAVAVQAQPTEPSPNNAPPVNIQENAPPPQDQQALPPVDNAPGADAANNSDTTAVNSATNTSTTAKPQNGSAGAPVTLVMGLTNDTLGYAPDHTAAARGGYAADVVPLITGTLPFARIHDELVEQLVALAGALQKTSS